MTAPIKATCNLCTWATNLKSAYADCAPSFLKCPIHCRIALATDVACALVNQ